MRFCLSVEKLFLSIQNRYFGVGHTGLRDTKRDGASADDAQGKRLFWEQFIALCILFCVGTALNLQMALGTTGSWVSVETSMTELKRVIFTLPSASVSQNVGREKKSSAGQLATADGPESFVVFRYRKQLSQAPDLLIRETPGHIFVELGPSADSSVATATSQDPRAVLYEIEIPKNPVSLHFHLRRAQVKVAEIPMQMAVTCRECLLDIAGAQGGLDIHALGGSVDVKRAKGGVAISTQDAKVQLSDIQGGVQFSALGGTLKASQIEGEIDIDANAGTLDLRNCAGEIEIDSARAAISLSGFTGKLRGELNDGSFSLGLAGLADVRLNSGDAAVAVQTPSGLGYSLRLQTEEGGIVLPSPMRSPRGSGPKTYVGKLSGEQKGTIAVRSQKGIIRLK